MTYYGDYSTQGFSMGLSRAFCSLEPLLNEGQTNLIPSQKKFDQPNSTSEIIKALNCVESPSPMNDETVRRLLCALMTHHQSLKENAFEISSRLIQIAKEGERHENFDQVISTLNCAVNYYVRQSDFNEEQIKQGITLPLFNAYFEQGDCVQCLELYSVVKGCAGTKEKYLVAKEMFREMRHKSGVRWKCVGILQDPPELGGKYRYCLQFDSKKEWNNRLHFPASESTSDRVSKFISQYPFQFKELGYELIESTQTSTLNFKFRNTKVPLNDFMLITPGVDAFHARSREFRKIVSDFPEFTLYESKGIATSEEFIQRHTEYDGVVSDGREKPHDETGHLIPRLMRAFADGKKYAEVRELEKQIFSRFLAKLQKAKHLNLSKSESVNLDRLMIILGTMVDFFTSILDNEYLKTKLQPERFEEYFSNLGEPENLSFHPFTLFSEWQYYLQKTFAEPGKQPLSDEQYKVLMKDLQDLWLKITTNSPSLL